MPEIISGAFTKALTSTNICAGFAKAGIHPFNTDWVKTHSHVFTVSKSLVQPDGDDAVRALRLHKFEDMVHNSTSKVSTSEMQYLDLTVSHQQRPTSRHCRRQK